MSPAERVLNTLNRLPTDRVPVDIWLTPEILDALRKYTGVAEEYDVYQKLGLDKIAWLNPNYKPIESLAAQGIHQDAWGVVSEAVQSGEALYYEVSQRPLEDMEEVSELEDYPYWPDPDQYDYTALRQKAERTRAYGFATLGPWISNFEIYCRMRGLENALIDLLDDPEFLEAALDRIWNAQTRVLERVFAELGDLVDMVLVSDDIGTQESQLMSMEHWNTHLKPRLTAWCDLIHQHGKKAFYHSDGAARPFIPGLIEAGIDILNPIQHVCPGMDREELKREYGDQLIFHGAIENQKVLPYGTTEDVRDETRRCLGTLGKGGGYIACSCHNVQPGTPIQNIITMIETVQNWTG
jgi:uroporphyrinogen decarboxylase